MLKGDLQGGKEITLTDSDLPVDGLKFTTDDVVFCDSAEAIGEAVDPTSYEEEVKKREVADSATTEKVKKAINGYYFEFYVSAGTQVLSHEIEFFDPDKFEIRSSLGITSTGKYEVRNGYIFITHDGNGETVEIPYEFKYGDITLYCSEAFSIYE